MLNFDPSRIASWTAAEREAAKNVVNIASGIVDVHLQAWDVAPQRSQVEWLKDARAELLKRVTPKAGDDVVQSELDTVLFVIDECVSGRYTSGEAPLERCHRILSGRLENMMRWGERS